MKRATAVATVVGLVAVTVAGLLSPWSILLAISAVAAVALRKGRAAFLVFAALSIALNVLFFAVFLGGASGAWLGFLGGLRIVAVTGANLAVLSWLSAEALLDGLRLPPRPTAFLAAVLIAAHDVGRDFAALRRARFLHEGRAHGFASRVAAAARLTPNLMVLALRRAEARRDALRLAGHSVSPRFAPLVAVTALAVAGRMALVAVPNVSLTYVVAFLGGLLFGWRVGAAAGLLAMAFTDLLLTGLLPVSFANAPAMALVGILGAAVAPLTRAQGRLAAWTTRLFAASAGLGGTFLFSLTSDALTWLIVPEYRGSTPAFWALALRGLAFNVVPGIVNAVLFAASVGPVQAAFRALRPAPSAARGAQVPPAPLVPPHA